MARQNAIRISKRMVDALTVETGDALFWDRELTGFGVRVYATGRKVYVVQMRGPTGSLRRVTIGRDVEITAEAARRTAAEAIDRIRSGEDPFPAPSAPEATVADLAERYMKAHVEVNCRPETVGIFRRVVDLYILPHLGALVSNQEPKWESVVRRSPLHPVAVANQSPASSSEYNRSLPQSITFIDNASYGTSSLGHSVHRRASNEHV